MILAETVWSALAGVTCVCYFMQQLVVLAGLHLMIHRALVIKKNRGESKHGHTHKNATDQALGENLSASKSRLELDSPVISPRKKKQHEESKQKEKTANDRSHVAAKKQPKSPSSKKKNR